MKLPVFRPRPAQTLLYFSADQVYRIDTDRKGTVLGALQRADCECGAVNALPYALETLFKQAAEKPGRKLWLFYDRLSCYLLSLPSVQVDGVSDEVLEQILQFEYEALSGLSAAKIRLAWRFMGESDEMNHYWVIAVGGDILDKLIVQAKKLGCRLGGLLHPGGLPAVLSADEAPPAWLRIECWPDDVFALASDPVQGFRLQILHYENNPLWREELGQWQQELGDEGVFETIMSHDIEYLPEAGEIYRFSDANTVLFWLDLWARHLQTGFEADAPFLAAEKKINRELVYRVGGGAAAFLLCAGHFSWSLYQKNQFSYQVEELRMAENTLSGDRKILADDQKKIAALKKQIRDIGGNIDVIPYAIASLQKRPAELLYRLARGNPGDLVIDGIDAKQDDVVIKGEALLPQLPNELVENIERPFNAVAWRVDAPTKKDMGLFSLGGPWQFEITLHDRGLKGFAKK